jgi:cytochrome c-type biogenesis protein CcmH/NrfF
VILRLAALSVAALVLAGSAAAACSKPRASLTALEGEIMCPTCHTTLDQSDSAAAHRIEHRIQQLIDRCATGSQIKHDLVQNFGAGILAAPPHKGFDLLAWWLPLGGVIVGALGVAVGVWRWTRARGPDEPPPPSGRLDEETERRLDELLARMD